MSSRILLVVLETNKLKNKINLEEASFVSEGDIFQVSVSSYDENNVSDSHFVIQGNHSELSRQFVINASDLNKNFEKISENELANEGGSDDLGDAIIYSVLLFELEDVLDGELLAEKAFFNQSGNTIQALVADLDNNGILINKSVYSGKYEHLTDQLVEVGSSIHQKFTEDLEKRVVDSYSFPTFANWFFLCIIVFAIINITKKEKRRY